MTGMGHATSGIVCFQRPPSRGYHHGVLGDSPARYAGQLEECRAALPILVQNNSLAV